MTEYDSLSCKLNNNQVPWKQLAVFPVTSLKITAGKHGDECVCSVLCFANLSCLLIFILSQQAKVHPLDVFVRVIDGCVLHLLWGLYGQRD